MNGRLVGGQMDVSQQDEGRLRMCNVAVGERHVDARFPRVGCAETTSVVSVSDQDPAPFLKFLAEIRDHLTHLCPFDVGSEQHLTPVTLDKLGLCVDGDVVGHQVSVGQVGVVVAGDHVDGDCGVLFAQRVELAIALRGTIEQVAGDDQLFNPEAGQPTEDIP